MLKKVLIALAVLVVVAVVAAVFFLDSIARAGIAAAGQYALGTKTSVREASIGIVSGKTAIQGLEVDNPAGYSPEKFVSLGAIEVGTQWRSGISIPGRGPSSPMRVPVP